MQGHVSYSAEIEIKLSIEGETLDKCWMSNNEIGEQSRKEKRKISTVDGFHTQPITQGRAIKLRTMGSGAG
jgi:hypothetical protein